MSTPALSAEGKAQRVEAIRAAMATGISQRKACASVLVAPTSFLRWERQLYPQLRDRAAFQQFLARKTPV